MLRNRNTYTDIAGTGISVLETNSGVAVLIDTHFVDIAKKYCWTANKLGYVTSNIKSEDGNRKHVYLHRLISNPDNSAGVVDHINGDTKDCRSENLRICMHRENLWNSRRKSQTITGIKGVTYDKRSGYFHARVGMNYKMHYLGIYKTAEEAADVVRRERIRMHGEYARHA